MKQPSHPSSTGTHPGLRRALPGLPGLLVLLGALGAACGDEPAPGILVFDRTSYDFGTVRLGQASDERTFTVRNAGPDTLDGLQARLEFDGGFELVGTTCVGWLEPSETCTITVAFAPSQGGVTQTDLIVEADRADARLALAGVAAVLVRVTNNAPGTTTVVSEPAGIDCGVVCEALVTAPEIVLSAGDGGTPIWSGACELTNGGRNCVLALQEDTSVELREFAVGVQWIASDVGVARSLVTDRANNIIGAGDGSPSLFKMSPEGELVWQTDDLGPGRAVVDARGYIGFLGYDNTVWKLDVAGNPEWSTEYADGTFDAIADIAFDPASNLYVAGTVGSFVKLVKVGSDGSHLWSITESLEENVTLTTLTVDQNGDVIISGYAPQPPPDGAPVHFLRKYDSEGVTQWTIEDLGFPGYDLNVAAPYDIFVASRTYGGAPGSYRLDKYTADGNLVWSTEASDIGGLVQGLALTDAGDVIAVGTRFGEAGGPGGVWAAKFSGIDGTRRRPVQVQLQGDPQYGHAVAVDSDGNVLLFGGEEPSWLRKYDGAVFDQPE